MGFHDTKHDFECSCCRWGWPKADGFRDTGGRLVGVCLMCAEHSEVTGKENAYNRLHDHEVEARRRYEIAVGERDQMLVRNGQLRTRLEQHRIDLSKAIAFLDTATVHHWPTGPGEGCRCGVEHCATCNVGANSWVLERVQKLRSLRRMIS